MWAVFTVHGGVLVKVFNTEGKARKHAEKLNTAAEKLGVGGERWVARPYGKVSFEPPR